MALHGAILILSPGRALGIAPNLGRGHVSEPLEIRDLPGPPMVCAVYALLPRAGASAAARELLSLLLDVAGGGRAALSPETA